MALLSPPGQTRVGFVTWFEPTMKIATEILFKSFMVVTSYRSLKYPASEGIAGRPLNVEPGKESPGALKESDRHMVMGGGRHPATTELCEKGASDDRSDDSNWDNWPIYAKVKQ